MPPQLLTLRRRTSRAVAAALSFSLFPPCRSGDASVRCRGEEVQTLHLPALGAVLTVFVQEHADYMGATVQDPFKGERYRH